MASRRAPDRKAYEGWATLPENSPPPSTDHDHALPTRAPAANAQLNCPECDYILTGAASERCPWCGWRINPDELMAVNSFQSNLVRKAVIVGGVILGVGTVLVSLLLVRRHRVLGMRDGMLIVGAFIAASGHLVTAAAAAISGNKWPMRQRELARIVTFLACTSIVVGLLGATSMFHTEQSPRMVRGVVVSGVFEFVLAAAMFTFPGWALVVLRLAAFRSGRAANAYKDTRDNRRDDDEPSGAPFRVVFSRRLSRELLFISAVDRPRPTNASVEAAIARTWEGEQAIAAQTDRILYNGQLARLEGLSAGDRVLSLQLGHTCYRDFLGTNLSNTFSRTAIPTEFLADPLGISANVLTSDGHLLFGRRSNRVASHAGYLHAFGGMVERAADGDAAELDLFDQMLRELTEELPVRRENVTSMVVIGLVRDGPSHQPELLFDIVLNRARLDIVREFEPSFGEGEHVAIESVLEDPQQIARFIDQAAPMAPVSQAALLLHGKHLWGDEWFTQSCFLLYGSRPDVS